MSPEDYNKRVLDELKAIRSSVEAIKRTLASGGGAPASGDGGFKGGAIADARDMDGDHGDPMIKYDPKEKYWGGDSFIGYRFSETSPEYLEAQAKYLDACAYMASKDADPKKQSAARFKAKDAARARGWAARLRNGWAPPGGSGGGNGQKRDDSATGYGGVEDDIPFISSEFSIWRP